MKPKKTLYNWLTTGFLLIIRNEENFAEKRTFSFNYAKVLVFGITIFVLVFGLCFYLSTTLLSMWFDPRHTQLVMNRNLLLLSAHVDSLEHEMERKDHYIGLVNKVISGEEDTLRPEKPNINEQSTKSSEDGLDFLTPEDIELRNQFETEEPGTVFIDRGYYGDLSESYFISPVKGVISGKYDPMKNHFGIDVVAEKNASVKSVADGTVVFSSWTLTGGNLTVVQHKSNLLSVYKHNSVLFKEEGETVKAGEVIALIGNSGEYTTGPHLHFELWYNGNPVDPQHFVSF